MPELTSAGLFKEWCPVRGEAWTHPGPGERGHVVRGGGVEGCHNPLGACVVAPSAGGLRRGGCWAGRTLRPGQLADRRRRKDGSAAQVSLMHGPRWPREDCVSLYLGDCRDDGPRWPREDRPRGPGPGVGAGLDVPGRGTGPVAQGRTSRGGSSEPCSRCRRGATWGGRTAPQKADDTCDKGAQAPGPGSAGALTGWWCKTPPAPPARRYRDGLRRMTVEVRSRRGLM